MQSLLLWVAVALATVKIASTIWLVRQPDATAVTATSRGRTIYLAGKASPALFIAALLARACIQRAPLGYILFCAVMMVVAIVMAVVVVRQRAAGTWHGLAHDIRQRRRRRRR